MMSVSNVSAGAAASGYYQAEGYYVAGSPEAEAAATWFGGAAEELAAMGQEEFAGRVDDAAFSAMLDGHAPPTQRDAEGHWKEGQTLGRVVDGERQHRPGIDLTFSASKSVSIIGLVAGDERVIAAHDEAVKAAMSYVEEKFVRTRREVNGEIVAVPGKMVAGLFRHDTSRALDPQLHTHAVIQNMVLGEDGKWTALSNEEIYRNKMLIGAIYRNELAQNLERAGYAVERVGHDGITEIKGVPRELMDGFSKRRKEIEAALDERGIERTAVDSALAALATRRNKQKGIDRAELREAWEKEAQSMGVSLDQLRELRQTATLTAATRLPGVTRDGIAAPSPADRAAAAVEFAIAHVSERNAVYSGSELVRVALSRAKDVGIRQIEGAIAIKEETGRLVPVHVHAWNEKRSPDAMTRGEGFSGTLKAMGTAPYQNDPRNRDSFFVTVETRNGEQTVWGAGLQAALERQEASPGSLVHLTVQGQKPVTVIGADGKPVSAHRNLWTAEVIERASERSDRSNGPQPQRETIRLYSDDATLALERMVLGEYRAARRQGGVELPARLRVTGGIKMSGEALLRDRLDKTTLTEGQKEAVALGLTGRGRFVGVQGYAGTGKTHMVETLRRYAERAGFTVEGAAPTNKAAAELASAVPAAGTVARFLLTDVPGDKKRSILVVDEAGMISTRDMHALMTKANELRYARVILVGDVKQLDPVSAGSPFAQLQKAGMPTAIMADIQRQRNEDAREAVLHAIRGEVRAAFSRIEDLRTPEKNQSFTGEVARAWLGLHSSVRERTGIVVLTNRVRGEVNAAIRDELKREHRLGAQDVTVASLTPLSLTRAEAREAASYKAGDVVISVRSVEGLERDKLYRVTSTLPYQNSITLRPEGGGAEVALTLGQGSKAAGSLAAFEVGKREFAAGDEVKFAITDKDRGAINGARGRITKVTEAGIDVTLHGGRKLSVPTDSLAARGLDHAYAATAHDFQGATVDRIIVGMTPDEQLTSQKSFYVNISRARDHVTLVTTDPGKLADRIQRETGERPAALDAYAQRLSDERNAAGKVPQNEPPSPTRDPDRVPEILREQAQKLRQAEPPQERTDRQVEQFLAQFEEKQKVKEGPIR